MVAENMFQLPVQFEDKELEFPARLVMQGYQAKFVVLIDEVEVIFERDDQGEFRAILPNAGEFTGKMPDRTLIEAVYKSIIAIS